MMTRGREIVLACAVALLLAVGMFAADKAKPSIMPAYRIEAGPFKASESDIRAVCDSAGRQLWQHFPDYTIEPFVVVRGQNGPITLFQRNPQGEIVLKLDTGQTFWCQYSYQFAHEFCHILMGLKPTAPRAAWFDETLCETASLYAMRAMARQWASQPPYANWREYRDALRDYTDKVLASRVERLGEIYRMGLPAFIQAHRQRLEKESCDRDLNGAMSVVLLALMEAQPQRWEAVRWLHGPNVPKDADFTQYLRAWHQAVPERHKAFVQRVADLYGVKLQTAAATTRPAA